MKREDRIPDDHPSAVELKRRGWRRAKKTEAMKLPRNEWSMPGARFPSVHTRAGERVVLRMAKANHGVWHCRVDVMHRATPSGYPESRVFMVAEFDDPLLFVDAATLLGDGDLLLGFARAASKQNFLP